MIETNPWYKIDFGYISGASSTQLTWPVATVNPAIFFSGVTRFAFENFTTSNLNLSVTPSYNITTKDGYLDLNFAYWSLTKLPCNYTCSVCGNGPQNCTMCPSSRVMSNSTCICNTRLFDNGTANCVACSPVCWTCTGNATFCTSCAAGVTLVNNTCVCAGILFYNGSSCQACNYACLTCSVTATNCLTCNSTVNRTLANSTCPCNLGYYDAGVATCAQCTIGNCQNCSSATVCVTCNTPYQALADGTCGCGQGYYSSAGSCVACGMTGCLQCSSVTVCTACDTSKGF